MQHLKSTREDDEVFAEFKRIFSDTELDDFNHPLRLKKTELKNAIEKVLCQLTDETLSKIEAAVKIAKPLTMKRLEKLEGEAKYQRRKLLVDVLYDYIKFNGVEYKTVVTGMETKATNPMLVNLGTAALLSLVIYLANSETKEHENHHGHEHDDLPAAHTNHGEGHQKDPESGH